MSGCNTPERLTKAERREFQQLKKKSRKTETEKELRRKEKALAEAAALLILEKKAQAIWGGRRGRMIIPEDRQMAIDLISEATCAGARQHKACEVIEISPCTLRRWQKQLQEKQALKGRRKESAASRTPPISSQRKNEDRL